MRCSPARRRSASRRRSGRSIRPTSPRPRLTASATGRWRSSPPRSDGEGPQGHLYPAFPYDSYTLMSDQEIADLHAALMARPANDAPSKAHEVGFPFNVRLAMAGWKHLFFAPKRFEADPSKSAEWNRGK